MNLSEPKYIPIVRLCAIKDKEISYGDKLMNTPERVVEWTRNLLRHADREYLLVVPISTRMRAVGIEIVAIGKINEIAVDMRNVFKNAILSNAIGVFIVHNHPSGESEPSREDIRITERMIKAGKLLDIDVIDHLIVTDNKHVSLRDTTNLWEM